MKAERKALSKVEILSTIEFECLLKQTEGGKNVLYLSDRYSGSRKKHYGRSRVRKVETACYFKG